MKSFKKHQDFQYFLNDPKNSKSSKIANGQEYWYCAYLQLLRNFMAHHKDDLKTLEIAQKHLPPAYPNLLSEIKSKGLIKTLPLYW